MIQINEETRSNEAVCCECKESFIKELHIQKYHWYGGNSSFINLCFGCFSRYRYSSALGSRVYYDDVTKTHCFNCSRRLVDGTTWCGTDHIYDTNYRLCCDCEDDISIARREEPD